MEDVVQQLRREVNSVVECVVELTGLPSRWDGTIHIVDNAAFAARKAWSCTIELSADMIERGERWPSIVHEAVHSVSVGLDPSTFLRLRGWEEGPTENLQRLIMADIATRMGIALDAALIESRAATHAFNRFCQAIEEIRVELGGRGRDTEPVRFYTSLIGIPLGERPARILNTAGDEGRLPDSAFMRVFSRANAILTGRIR